MNIHKNARLTLRRRQEMVQDVVYRKMTLTAAAMAHGVSMTLPGFDVHQEFDNVLMNGERDGQRNGTEP